MQTIPKLQPLEIVKSSNRQAYLSDINNWLLANQFSLSIPNTEEMLIGSDGNPRKPPEKQKNNPYIQQIH